MNWFAVVCLTLSVAVLVPSPKASLARLQPPSAPRRQLRRLLVGRAGAPTPGRRMLGGLGALAATWLLTASWWGLGIGLVAALGMVVALGHVGREDPARSPLGRELPEALDLLAASIEAGAPIGQAAEVVAGSSRPATRDFLGRVASHLALGRSPGDAWTEVADGTPWADAALDLARAERSGTPIQEALRIHADEARRRRQEAATARARSVGVRSMVPLMVCFLPAFLLVGVVPIIAGLLASILG